MVSYEEWALPTREDQEILERVNRPLGRAGFGYLKALREHRQDYLMMFKSTMWKEIRYWSPVVRENNREGH